MEINKEHILNVLKSNKPLFQTKLGINSLALFGSYARNAQSTDSDIDFLIELKDINYLTLHKAFVFLEEKFPGKKIQLIRKGPHLSGHFLNSIQKDLIYV